MNMDRMDGGYASAEREAIEGETEIRIGVMSDTDLGRVRELRGAVGWPADPLAFDLLRGVRDARWAVAEGPGALAGMVGVVPLGGVGIVFHLAVREEMRGLGIGRTLSSWAVAYLRSRGVGTVRLYSTLGAEGLYRGMGFVPVGRRAVYRIEGRAKRWETAEVRGDGRYSVTPLTFGEVPELRGADYWAYGGDRSALILATLRLHRGGGWLARDASGRIKGYLIEARSDPTIRFGPLAAATPDVAQILLSTALARHESERAVVSAALTVPAPTGDAEPSAHTLLEGLGFSGHPDRLCMELRTTENGVGISGTGLTLYGTTPYLAT